MRKWFIGMLAAATMIGIAAQVMASGTVEIEEIAVGPRMFSSTFLSEDIVGFLGIILVSLVGFGFFALHWAAGVLAVIMGLIVVGFLLGADDIISAMGLAPATLGEAEVLRSPAALAGAATGVVSLIGFLSSRQGRQYLPLLVGVSR